MENKEFYTKEERIMLDGISALEKLNKALQLDLLLLELEASVGLMDGLPLEKGEA